MSLFCSIGKVRLPYNTAILNNTTKGGLLLNVIRNSSNLDPRPKYFYQHNVNLNVTRSMHTINNPNQDTTHFFSRPKNSIFTKTSSTSTSGNEIGQAIRQYQNRKRRFAIWFTITSLISILLGYKIVYKVIYKGKETYIPLFPCSKYHELSTKEKNKLNVNNVKTLVVNKLMIKLTSHDFIKEQYGVPLQISINDKERASKFKVWCEDEDIVVFGLRFKPNDGVSNDHHGKKWHMIPGLFKWKFSHQSINYKERVQDILDFVGIKYDKMISPEITYDTFKYEVPIHSDDQNNNNHSMHICFYGELDLDDKSKVTFKGKYHVDVKFEEINVLRKEDGKLVDYILYKD